MRFSPSRLATWMRCPLQAKFKYVDQLPQKQGAKATFGTIIHHCLELYDNGSDIELVMETFKDLWHYPEKLGVAPEVWPKFTSHGGLRDKGLEILKTYDEKHRWDTVEVIATEHGFLVPFGKHELTGYIDKIEVKKSGKGQNLLRVVDHKTGTFKPSLSELALNIQFTIYEYATHQEEFWVGNGPDFPGVPNGEWQFATLADMPRRCIWSHLWTNTELDAGGRCDEDYLRVYRLCEQIERAYEHEVFVPDISGSSCLYCDYVPQCGLKIPTKEELAAEDNAWI